MDVRKKKMMNTMLNNPAKRKNNRFGLPAYLVPLSICLMLILGACRMSVTPEGATIEVETPAAGEATPVIDATPLADVTPAPGALDVIGTVLAADDLTVLASALVASELADDLKEAGPFTLLAPTDAAFANVVPELLDSILADPLLLASILQYHLIVDDVTAAELATLGTAATVQGETLTISLTQDATILVNGANIVEADLVASNGRVHKIDTLLIPATIAAVFVPTPTPAAGATVTESDTVAATDAVTASVVVTDGTVILQPTPVPPVTGTNPVTVPDALTATIAPPGDMSTMTILEIINIRPELSTVATALAAAGLSEALILPGPFTLFAPTNDAFTALPADVQASVLNEGTARAAMLQRHLIADSVNAAQLATLGSALSTSGETLSITLGDNGVVLVDGVPIVESIQASNGVVHIMSGVVLAPAP